MANNNFVLNDFEKSVKNLKEILEEKKTDIVRDAAIKRFELCFDLNWKLIKNFAKKQGVECLSPRQCFKVGFQLKIIEHDEKWLNMINDRNLSTHLYKEEKADEIYSKLSDYLKLFQSLLDKANQKFT